MLIKMLGAVLVLAVFSLPAVAQNSNASEKAFENVKKRPRPNVGTIIRNPGQVPQCDQDTLHIIVQPCGDDEILVIHDVPVYDENGLFVVCYKKVPFCIPANTPPAG